VLLSSAGGVNFWAGNNPAAPGWFALPDELAQGRSDMYAHSARIAQGELGRELTASEVSAHFTERGLAFWRDEPGAALALFARKLLLFWSATEFTDVVDLELARRYSPVLWAGLGSFAVVGPLALLGLVVAWRRPGSDARALRVLVAFLAANALFMAVFFVSSRFRVSALPAVYPFAAIAVVWLVETARARPRRTEPLALAVAALALLAYFVNDPPAGAGRASPAVGEFNLGAVHYREGRYAEAEPFMRRAVALDPSYAKAWYHLASSLKLQGRLAESEPLFERAFALDPDDARGLTFYAALLLDTNRPAQALALLERALALDPSLGIAAVGQGVAHERLGNVPRAVELYRHAAAIDPSRAADVERRLARLGVR
jgi:tetratricopeptide (TPR) repeat protein